ncbi:MAG: hypothetical protein A2Y38_13205 [Spirochaetes bacterium GWB1_59_5]|nr:MAG: hypothetical protein A2Y38_13205 [Spirochaetes bacterium GWB1_59_5]
MFRVKERALWRVKQVAETVVTLGPLTFGVAAAANWAGIAGSTVLGLGAPVWLGIFGAVEAVHLAEIQAAIRAWKNEAERKGRLWTRASAVRAVAATLCCGYPSWVPRNLKIFN